MSIPRLIEASFLTDQGQIRNHNEDYITCWEPVNRQSEIENGWLYIVADGVGGADAGEIASQYASERAVEHYLNDYPDFSLSERLWKAMQAANTDLRQMVAERDDDSRMATTMVAALFQNSQVYVANVGDSRGYHWRNGRLQQITKDQSLVAKLVEEGAITEEEAINHPRKNVILYSLGSEKEPKIDVYELTVQAGDILFLCSDGLTRHVADEEIERILLEQEPPEATQTLVALANERGGEDNISVAVLRYDQEQAAVQQNLIATGTSSKPVSSRMLWLYTIILSLVQTILIILVWFLLRV